MLRDPSQYVSLENQTFPVAAPRLLLVNSEPLTMPCDSFVHEPTDVASDRGQLEHRLTHESACLGGTNQ